MDAVITDVTTTVAAVPLKRPFKTALRTVTTAQTVIVKVVDSEGVIGYGEAAPTPVITGDTLASITNTIEELIAPKIIGLSLKNADQIKELIETAAVHNSSPKAAVNIALNDLLAQHYQVPMYQYLGGYRDHIVTDYTVSVGSIDEMLSQAGDLINEGFDTLKIKVGSESEAADLQKVIKLRESVGPDIKLRLDANQGWHPKQAAAMINKMSALNLGIELVEQPVAATDFLGMQYVTQHTETPIMADESIFSVADAQRLVAMKGCDIVNIKLMKAGGLDNALAINAICEANRIPCMVGSMIESSVSVSAAAALAAAKRNIKYVDLDASMMFSSNPVAGGIVNEGNQIHFSDQFGLGF